MNEYHTISIELKLNFFFLFSQIYHVCRSFVSLCFSVVHFQVALPLLRTMRMIHFEYHFRVYLSNLDHQNRRDIHFAPDNMGQFHNRLLLERQMIFDPHSNRICKRNFVHLF